MSFALPIVLFGSVLGLLTLTSYIPGFFAVSNQGSQYMLNFLAVFGDGKPLQGIITLGITVSIAGILLDILNFYRYQSLRDKNFESE
ncbi:hypothetical protein C7B62_14940 [Pleurocapsa sp. CCALA 161]|nr:hypothetical protein C7B62_14940 [Pleurocapsa sp. CCALA 161]